MAAPAQPPAEPTCPYRMSDRESCGRLIHPAPAGVDKEPRCLMHSADPEKDWAAFQAEIKAILEGKSKDHRPADRFDFRGFVFTQDADFSGATFTQNADFRRATFTQDADFFGATFTRNANFYGARFTQNANFSGATFTRNADFSGATFTQSANFSGATFTQYADFFLATFTQDANFFRATFTQDADFFRATFTQNANFSWATFTQDANFYEATFTQDADFFRATFTQSGTFREANVVGVLDFRFAKVLVLKDGEVLLHRVNRVEEVEVPDTEAAKAGEKPPKKKFKVGGLRVRLRNSLLERMRFEDVRWYQREGRLVLQDELDLDDPEREATHELVADAYRRLVNNFEKARQYEWAEQAVVGEMEMRRRNPERFLLAGWAQAEGNWFLRRWQRRIGKFAKNIYGVDAQKRPPEQPEKHPRVRRCARWLGEHVSSIYLYRLLSFYGTSYLRALGALAIFLLIFVLAFPIAGLRPRDARQSGVVSWAEAWHDPDRREQMKCTFEAGVVAALETATFQRDPAYRPASNAGRMLAAAELIVIPGQVALVLLALRRRFRR